VNREEWFVRPISNQTLGILQAYIGRFGIRCIGVLILSGLQLDICGLQGT
jgi:hypothetical protein